MSDAAWRRQRISRRIAVGAGSPRRRSKLINGIDPTTGRKYVLSVRGYNRQGNQLYDIDVYKPVDVRGTWIWGWEESVYRNLPESKLQKTPFRLLTRDDVQGLPLTAAEVDLILQGRDLRAGEVDWRPTETIPEDYHAL